MEEDCGGGQGLTKGCGAKGRRRISPIPLIVVALSPAGGGGGSGRGVKLTTHFQLVSRLRMRSAIPPLPQYVFTAVFRVWYLFKHKDNFTL
jgi:hypothetical protein